MPRLPSSLFRGPFAAAERNSSRDAPEELDPTVHFSTSTICFPPWQEDRPRWLLVPTTDHHDLSISDYRMSLSPRGTAQQAVGAIFGRLGAANLQDSPRGFEVSGNPA